MKISGKNDRILSVLIPNRIIESIDLIVQERSIMKFDLNNNYLFAAQTGTGFVDPHPLYKRYSELYCLAKPLDMRGTNLRKLHYNFDKPSLFSPCASCAENSELAVIGVNEWRAISVGCVAQHHLIITFLAGIYQQINMLIMLPFYLLQIIFFVD